MDGDEFELEPGPVGEYDEPEELTEEEIEACFRIELRWPIFFTPEQRRAFGMPEDGFFIWELPPDAWPPEDAGGVAPTR
jgi:hypothetical protein